ncbi:MAG: winged helix-turn-helix transcriptional regulator [Euryarchaeota archaeon]|nr:winged helix-turn-helix transcriptional regulator [Euryarchaeota archaeon]
MSAEKSGDDWNAVSYVISSELRLKILIHLSKDASTPSSLARALNEPISRISTALKELSELGAVVCLTPERKKGRLYRATDKGIKIIGIIHSMTDIHRK